MNSIRTQCQLGWCAVCGARVLSVARPRLLAPAHHMPHTCAAQPPFPGAAGQRPRRIGGIAAPAGRHDAPCRGCAAGGRSECAHHGRPQSHRVGFNAVLPLARPWRPCMGSQTVMPQPEKCGDATNQPIGMMCNGVGHAQPPWWPAAPPVGACGLVRAILTTHEHTQSA